MAEEHQSSTRTRESFLHRARALGPPQYSCWDFHGMLSTILPDLAKKTVTTKSTAEQRLRNPQTVLTTRPAHSFN